MKSQEFDAIKDWHIIEITLLDGRCFSMERPRMDIERKQIYGDFIREINSNGKLGQAGAARRYNIEDIAKLDIKTLTKDHIKSEALMHKALIIILVSLSLISINFCS